jgi:hypothetical protein
MTFPGSHALPSGPCWAAEQSVPGPAGAHFGRDELTCVCGPRIPWRSRKPPAALRPPHAGHKLHAEHRRPRASNVCVRFALPTAAVRGNHRAIHRTNCSCLSHACLAPHCRYTATRKLMYSDRGMHSRSERTCGITYDCMAWTRGITHAGAQWPARRLSWITFESSSSLRFERSSVPS